MKMNMNDKVKVVLTKTGISQYEKFHVDLNLNPEKYKNSNNTYELSLWELSLIFGNEMYMGNTKHPFFENNEIEII